MTAMNVQVQLTVMLLLGAFCCNLLRLLRCAARMPLECVNVYGFGLILLAKLINFQIVCFVLMLFLMDGRAQWHFYTFAYVTTVVLIVCTFLLLVALYFELPAANKSLPWLYIEMGFDLIACLLCLIVAAVFVYDFVLMTSGRFGHHKYMPPLNIGRDGWKNRIGVCAVRFAR
ncbi:unnamed protein product [Toxocara canis]|uniref:MARVEL domain-containing protein n=1 Tax=Toxocara canis TaxID=6265 RepID=A0A183UCM4_TOXCA|nr:unnamed protein product [Toxocara canis]